MHENVQPQTTIINPNGSISYAQLNTTTNTNQGSSAAALTRAYAVHSLPATGFDGLLASAHIHRITNGPSTSETYEHVPVPQTAIVNPDGSISYAHLTNATNHGSSEQANTSHSRIHGRNSRHTRSESSAMLLYIINSNYNFAC